MGTAYSYAQSNLPQLGKNPVSEVINAMTLEEKASLVVGAGLNIPEAIKKANKELALNVPMPGTLASQTVKPVPSAAGNTVAIPRLGIPSMVVNDGPAGMRLPSLGNNIKCTAFPIGTLLASSWDKDLMLKTGQAFGNETLEYGVDILLAPGMNIQRNPLCGRNFEYYSEDPLLTGKLAAAFVQGVQSQGVGTSVKHFIVNNQETDRNSVNIIVSERALREIYLKGFQIAVQEAEPWTVMSSYNLVNGSYTSERHDLITEVLRNDWGYKGLVMSDWNGGKDAVAQMKARNALLMPGPSQVKTIIEALKSGRLNEKVLDQNVEDILNLILKTPRFKNYKFSNKPNTEANLLTSRTAASEGMVLLKNNQQTLPLAATVKNVALFGNTSYAALAGGSGSGFVNTAYTASLADGLLAAGYTANVPLKETYKKYMDENRPLPQKSDMMDGIMGRKKRAAEMPVNEDMATQIAQSSDMGIITIGRISGEGSDRALDNDYNLSDTEKAMIRAVAKAFHAKGKKVVIVLNIGGVIETVSWKDLPDAILLAWQPGQEAGHAMADVLSGKVNPSGKLPVTFPEKYSDVPSAKNFPGKEVKNDSIIKREVIYEEGIYVGYRYYNTFGVKTSYPFGFGMSYTSFAYSNMQLSSANFNDKISVIVDVKNTGAVAGKEVVQLYIAAPAKSMKKPALELKGFAKTELLKPGQSKTITFTINAIDLASYSTEKTAWIADAGRYILKIGASSDDIRLSKSFNLKKERIVAGVTKALVPSVQINELKR
jgi:beta-glucosidase